MNPDTHENISLQDNATGFRGRTPPRFNPKSGYNDAGPTGQRDITRIRILLLVA